MSARLGAEGLSQREQGPPAMPTLHLARTAIKGRDAVAAHRMLAWHARAMHSFWLTSNHLISDQSDSVDQGHIKPPKGLWKENYFHSCILTVAVIYNCESVSSTERILHESLSLVPLS